jgi:hypothetical protein
MVVMVEGASIGPAQLKFCSHREYPFAFDVAAILSEPALTAK